MAPANAESPSPSALQPRVRSARSDDLAQLTEILASSFYTRTGLVGWLYPLLKLGICEDLRQRLRSQSSHYVCLAAIQQSLPIQMAALTYCDCVIGTVELSQRYAFPWQPMQPQHLYLSNLAVHADFRRQGVAQKLLKACERVAQDWGFNDLYLHVMEDNVQARHLYGKAGFSLMSTKGAPLPKFHPYPRRLLMHKSLAAQASGGNDDGLSFTNGYAPGPKK